jgi:hypothetical protein
MAKDCPGITRKRSSQLGFEQGADYWRECDYKRSTTKDSTPCLATGTHEAEVHLRATLVIELEASVEGVRT